MELPRFGGEFRACVRANPTILRRYDIVRLPLFLYVKQRFTNIALWSTLTLARFLHLRYSFRFPTAFIAKYGICNSERTRCGI